MSNNYLFRITGIILFSTLLLFSCKKENPAPDNTGGNGGGNGTPSSSIGITGTWTLKTVTMSGITSQGFSFTAQSIDSTINNTNTITFNANHTGSTPGNGFKLKWNMQGSSYDMPANMQFSSGSWKLINGGASLRLINSSQDTLVYTIETLTSSTLELTANDPQSMGMSPSSYDEFHIDIIYNR